MQPVNRIIEVPARQHETSVGDTDPSSVIRGRRSEDSDVRANTDVALDLSTTPHRLSQSAGSQRPENAVLPPASKELNAAAQMDIYQRYMDDLKRLDDLIRRRTYERNVLSWRRDQTKRSLERLLRPVEYIQSYRRSHCITHELEYQSNLPSLF